MTFGWTTYWIKKYERLSFSILKYIIQCRIQFVEKMTNEFSFGILKYNWQKMWRMTSHLASWSTINRKSDEWLLIWHSELQLTEKVTNDVSFAILRYELSKNWRMTSYLAFWSTIYWKSVVAKNHFLSTGLTFFFFLDVCVWREGGCILVYKLYEEFFLFCSQHLLYSHNLRQRPFF